MSVCPRTSPTPRKDPSAAMAPWSAAARGRGPCQGGSSDETETCVRRGRAGGRQRRRPCCCALVADARWGARAGRPCLREGHGWEGRASDPAAILLPSADSPTDVRGDARGAAAAVRPRLVSGGARTRNDRVHAGDTRTRHWTSAGTRGGAAALAILLPPTDSASDDRGTAASAGGHFHL